jgi:alpha-L-fucosidase
MKKFTFIIALLALLSSSCTQTPPPKPHGPLPEARQLAWNEMEYYAFVHFSMNTFTNIEWGYGDKDPKLFNPSELNCKQWVKVFKDAGMKGVILTAKHHDGFCLWPSKYTDYSVKASPWRNGKGDLLRELSDACKEAGLKFGVYLSPWDRNHKDYGKPEYITYFRNQLRELLTNYGDIFEVWFDGANGGDGYYGGAREVRKIDRKTYYDWPNTYKLVYELQPNAILFSDAGPGCRWCGNEEGWVRPTNWSLLKRDDFYPGVSCDREFLRAGQEDGTHWVPAEVDVSIRPGWFYHKSEDHKVKTLPHLLDIYYHSVGRNGNLLLNFPVDQRGLIHEKDVEQVMKLANVLKQDFANNLAKGKKFTATNTRGNSSTYSVDNVNDNNKETYWATDDNVTSASITIDLGTETEVNRFLAQEYIALGQRVQKFTLEAMVNNSWKEIASETTIGYKRILRFPTVKTSQLRFNITHSKACPLISNIEIYNAPMVLNAPVIRRNQANEVSLSGADDNVTIYYTIDGTTPSAQSKLYSQPFTLSGKATVKAICIDTKTGKKGEVTSEEFDISRANWKIKGREQETKTFDGNPNTSWRKTGKKFPLDVVIDLGQTTTLKGFTYLPEQSRWSSGIVFKYQFFTSTNGRNWKQVSKGEFSNIKNSPIWQKKLFSPTKARYVKFKALSTTDDRTAIGIAEFDILTK